MRRLVLAVPLLLLVISSASASGDEYQNMVTNTDYQGRNLGVLLRADRKKIESAMDSLVKSDKKLASKAYVAAALADIKGLEKARKPAMEGDDYRNALAYYLMHARPKSDDRLALDCWLETSDAALRNVSSHLREYRLDAGTLGDLKSALEKGGIGGKHQEDGLEILNKQVGMKGLSLAKLNAGWAKLTEYLKQSDKEFVELNKRKSFRLLKTVDVGELSGFCLDPQGKFLVGYEKEGETWTAVKLDAHSGKRVGGKYTYFEVGKDSGTVPSPRVTGDGKQILLWGAKLKVLDADSLELVHAEDLDVASSGWKLSGDRLSLYKLSGAELVVRGLTDPAPTANMKVVGGNTLFSSNMKFCACSGSSEKEWELFDLTEGKSLRKFEAEVTYGVGLTDDGAWLIMDSSLVQGRVAVSTTTGVNTFRMGDSFAKWKEMLGRTAVMEWENEAWCVVHATSGRILGVVPRPEGKQNHLVGVSEDGRLLVTRSFVGDPNAAAKARSTGDPNDNSLASKVTSELQIWSGN